MPLDDLNRAVKKVNFTAGWNKNTASLWAEPKTPYTPRHWRYTVAKENLDRAGELISTDLAERRNLLMFDDADPNQYATTHTVVAAYQMLKPGEHARAHRHSPSALRLVLESGNDVATVVDGVELPMSEGSVLLTPGGAWHSHFNSGSANSYWIDVLDVPLVHQLEPMFFDHHPDEYQKTEQRPVEHPFLISRSAIDAKLRGASANEQGVTVINISNDAIPTLELNVLRFSDNSRVFDVQETSNSIFAVMTGSGELFVEGQTIQWSFGDVFSLPMWKRGSLNSADRATLLRVSDKPVMEKLGLFRRAAD